MRRTAAVLAAITLGLVGSTFAPAPSADADSGLSWQAIALRPLVGGEETHVADINSEGTSVGWEVHNSQFAPVRWDAAGNPTLLEVPQGCTSANAHGISDSGYVTGIAQCAGQSNLGMLWLPNGSALKLLTGQNGYHVTNGGITVGGGTPSAGPVGAIATQAYVYFPGQPRLDLPEAGYVDSSVGDITEWGYIVGTLSERQDNVGPTRVAVGWYGNTVFPLLRTAESTYGVSVNEAGHALVQIQDLGSGVSQRGYIVAPGGKVQALADAGANDLVSDINDYDIVVGATQAQSGGAYAGAFYAFGTTIRLDSLVPAETASQLGLDQPVALNNAAWVVGNHRSGDTETSWLLRPVAGLPTTG